MAMIHVNRGATSLGVFSEEEVREGLRTGRFAATDIGWREGMANWQPLSQFAELAGAAAAAPPLQTDAAAISEAAAPRSGLPWEHRQERGFFNAFVETLVMVLTKPGEAFTAMKREGGLGEPLIYALIGGCVGGVVSLLFSLFSCRELFVAAADCSSRSCSVHWELGPRHSIDSPAKCGSAFCVSAKVRLITNYSG